MEWYLDGMGAWYDMMDGRVGMGDPFGYHNCCTATGWSNQTTNITNDTGEVGVEFFSRPAFWEGGREEGWFYILVSFMPRLLSSRVALRVELGGPARKFNLNYPFLAFFRYFMCVCACVTGSGGVCGGTEEEGVERFASVMDCW